VGGVLIISQKSHRGRVWGEKPKGGENCGVNEKGEKRLNDLGGEHARRQTDR